MTEEEWWTCTSLDRMLKEVGARGLDRRLRRGQCLATDRKVRLLACAFARSVWTCLSSEWACRAVEAAEAFADGRASPCELLSARDAAQADHWATVRPGLNSACLGMGVAEDNLSLDARAVGQLAGWIRGPLATHNRRAAQATEQRIQCDLIRDVFGPVPFRPVSLDPPLLTQNSGLVRGLAEEAYEHRQLPEGTLDPVRLAVLADALEEARGDREMVGHLREQGSVHVRGCWVVDLLLNKA